MKLPTDIEDQYLNEVLANRSLEDLPGEEWKLIEGFENYAISNYGRIKSLERCVINSMGGVWRMKDTIKKPRVYKYFNKQLNKDFYTVRGSLSSEGKDYGKSIPRLVYYHFVEKFDMEDRTFLISFKDNNQFHVHADNLEKLTVSELHYKTMKLKRGKKRDFDRPVDQYTVEGDFIASYDNMDAAADSLGISRTNILDVIEKEQLTAGEFRWFLKNDVPTKDDFVPVDKKKADKILNTSIWNKLGRPDIDKNNPPACMNLSLADLPDEVWKPIPGIEDRFHISNKGRIKRLNTWTPGRYKRFIGEHIMALFLNFYSDEIYYFFVDLNYNGKRVQIRINKYLYYCL
ncbi:NUMOD4 domain-containing protein [uncultured Chryseobacterium sp.]|uniref:NUMOD4 domain-containing protein n=1 Tax=uncultured Chryseobacterium sp. TaxID=259322 RepID=UPI0025E36718|nr:NUMOD4 domain-containing protein [uncultured Chryseobacterium sp.]